MTFHFIDMFYVLVCMHYFIILALRESGLQEDGIKNKLRNKDKQQESWKFFSFFLFPISLFVVSYYTRIESGFKAHLSALCYNYILILVIYLILKVQG